MYPGTFSQKRRINRIQKHRDHHQQIPLDEAEVQEVGKFATKHNQKSPENAQTDPGGLKLCDVILEHRHRYQNDHRRHGGLNQCAVNGGRGLYGCVQESIEAADAAQR